MERKLLAILLVLTMLVTFAPAAVFADTDDVSTADESTMLSEYETGEGTEGGADADPPHAEAGWDESHCHYYNEDGSLATGWIEEKHSIELASGDIVNWSDWYYADDKGEIRIGWLKYHRKWYYLFPGEGETYGRMCTDPIRIDGKTYVIKKNGVLNTDGWYHATGFVSDGTIKLYYDEWYYSDPKGVAAKGWQKISSKWYYFNASGIMQTGWQKIEGKWYYFNSLGAMQTGWQKINSKWYYFNSSGVMKTGWQKISGNWYYFNKSGVMQTGWQKINGNWYYFNSSGVMQTSKWIGSYYVKSNGCMAVSEITPDGYYVGSDGKYIGKSGTGTSTGIVYWTDGGSVYHLRITCPSLARSTNIHSGTIEQSHKTRACKNCG